MITDQGFQPHAHIAIGGGTLNNTEEEWIERLVPASPGEAAALKFPGQVIQYLKDPTTGLFVVLGAGARLPNRYHTSTYQQLPKAVGELSEVILTFGGEVWIRTTNSGLLLVPAWTETRWIRTSRRSSIYLAHLVDGLLDDITFSAPNPGQGVLDTVPSGLIKLFAEAAAPGVLKGTSFSRRKLEKARR